MRTTLFVLLLPSMTLAAEPNVWVKHTAAQIEGRRWDVPVGFSPELKRFMVLGGRTSWAEAKKPRSYDVLSLDTRAGKWRNELPPEGKDWGAEFGSVTAPAWKSESWGFKDASGNTRPNWSIYGTFSLGGLYALNTDDGSFYFHAGNSTFRYQPKERAWTELQQKTGPAAQHGGVLLWSSMCYDQGAKRFILFGGGNIQTERGDPGTWTFDPETKRWEQLELAKQPPARANSRLVYDPVNKLTVLFGGDQLDQLVADTWVFDSAKKTWTERKPEVSPSPRGGHALLWLPKSKKVLLLGGFTYTSTTGYVASLYQPLPFEAWTYDVETNRWAIVANWGKDAPVGSANGLLGAAVDADDNVMVLDSQNRAWTCQIDVSKPDSAATSKLGAAPGSVVRRKDSHDPKWYSEGRPAPDAAAVAERLKKLPVNEWVPIPTDNAPKMNMDWGSAVFDTANDKIVRFSGGHSAYSGTAPFVYDVKTDRYSLPFAPEYPLEYVYSNDQVDGEWSFQGRPWMTGHTYKSTGYDPNLKAMIFAAHGYTYSFDSSAGKWSRFTEKNPFRADFYNSTVCTTPEGAVTWARQAGGGPGIWRLHAETKIWKPLPLPKDARLPEMNADHHGLAFDSKRNRLLFFSDIGTKKGNVATYDIAGSTLKWLDPAGAEQALGHCRETIYLPELDMVLIGARTKDSAGNWRWVGFDCATDGWVTITIPGDDPIGKRPIPFNNSMGLMYDPARKLVWAVGQHSQVYVLNLDRAKADIKPVK
ncbi:MAG: hypothetical protein C0467_00540 [Planctomycetaceae bacterium]|nr:hypothetical protein [Planctomycetaceae bacterium]